MPACGAERLTIRSRGRRRQRETRPYVEHMSWEREREGKLGKQIPGEEAQCMDAETGVGSVGEV